MYSVATALAFRYGARSGFEKALGLRLEKTLIPGLTRTRASSIAPGVPAIAAPCRNRLAIQAVRGNALTTMIGSEPDRALPARTALAVSMTRAASRASTGMRA